jgi:hypothetical protein
MVSNFSHRLVFPEELENLFLTYVRNRLKALSGITVFEFWKKAFELAEKNNLKMPESWSTNRIAGKMSRPKTS